MIDSNSLANPCAKRPGDWGFEPPKVCGCRVGKVCKHYNSNMRQAIQSSDSRREETGGGSIGRPLVQTYFSISVSGTRIVGPNDRGESRLEYLHRRRMAKRL